ncbi:MAG: hypothetical protein K2N01_03130 [Lachnospiraceae bacterium]|nr:hypothetical protein [Lachnospiraceae bacterium]
MKKKILIFLEVVSILLFTSCQNSESGFTVSETEEADDVSYQAVYDTLNTKELREALFKAPVDDVTVQNEHAFEELPYEGEMFPPELIAQMEKALYSICGFDSMNIPDDNEYFDLLKELGSETYEMSVEAAKEVFPNLEEHRYCAGAFHFKSDEGKEYYLFCYESNGSYGQYFVYLDEYINGETISRAAFDTQNHGFGKVISYENEFYYVFLQYNYNLKFYDGIRLHKLGSNADTENILIRYVPEEFEWRNLEQNSDVSSEELDDYVEEVKESIVSGQYLEVGEVGSFFNIYEGDETDAPEFPLTEKYKQYEKVDFANMGIPVYFRATIYEPSVSGICMHLQSDFFLYDLANEEVLELENLRIDDGVWPHENELVQLWYKEIEGKIYTFQMFHLSNYNYMLRVVLVEGDQVTQIRREILLPKKGFKLTEGEEFIYM